MANEPISSAPDAGAFNATWRLPVAVSGNTSPFSTSAGILQGPLSLSGVGITGNALLGTLPANSWLLRLLLRDLNNVGGSVGLGSTSGGTDILSLQAVPASGTYSLTVDISAFAVGSFASGATPSIYVTYAGGGASFSVKLDYEIGP